MRRFFKDKHGSAILWALFLILILFTLTAVIYTGVTVYAKYQTCETELERAALVTVDASMKNAAVRDLVLDVPATDAESLFYDNLRELGYEKTGNDWVKGVDGKTVYTLTEFEAVTDGKAMTVTAVLSVPVMWKIGGTADVRIPIQAKTSVLYIQP